MIEKNILLHVYALAKYGNDLSVSGASESVSCLLSGAKQATFLHHP